MPVASLSSLAGANTGAPYRRRDPESTDLHRLVRDNLDAFLGWAREHYAKPLPRYVERELWRLVDCGVLARGFCRWRCPRCGHDLLVAFSCKTRSCPSCAGRRMAQAGAHLVDRVLPDVPLRQWVLTVPYPLRRLLAADAKILGTVLRIFVRVVDRFYLDRARDAGIANPKTGMLTVSQRFGGSMNLHVHVHGAAIDGVYALDESTGSPRFHFVPAPTPSDIHAVAASVGARVCKMLRRRGLLRDEPTDSGEATTEGSALDACRSAGLSRGRFERIDERGRSQQQLLPDDDARFARRTKSPWAAEVDGFSVDAGVCFGALDRKGREKLVRYFLRPAIAIERLSILRDGSVAYRTKYGRGAKTHRVMTPMEAMARIAALVPPPSSPLLRYHGVLAAGSPLRSRIVPVRDRPRDPGCPVKSSSKRDAARATGKPGQPATAPTPTTGVPAPTAAAVHTPPTSPRPQPTTRSWRPSTSYIPWAELMRRTLDVNPARCTRCQGRLEPVAIVTREDVVRRILSHLSLPLQPAPIGPGGSIAYDVSGEPLGDWIVGVNPEPPSEDARGPPSEWDGIDAPGPDG